ncbi:MAG: S8 family serine peptidase, partial [Myxococcota bacterium]
MPLRRVVPLLLLALAGCPTPAPQGGAITFFRATPPDISRGDSVQLSWESTHAEACQLEPGGEVAPSGATLVSPTETTTYALRCNGATASVQVTVRVAPRITSFLATPTTVAPDGQVTLAWASEGTDACSLSPGVGEVAVTGSQTLVATQTTTFTLTCRGTSGPDATASATVTVMPTSTLPMPTGVMVTPLDGMLRVSWTQTTGSGVIYFAEAAGITAQNIDTLPGRVVFRRVTSPFTISGLVNDKPYYLRVSAISGADESALTAEVSGTPTGPATGSDPYFSEQWHLANGAHEDVNVEPVWATGVKGQGVPVAIVDEGVDLAHEDLKQNVATAMSHDYLGNAALRLAEHGTCVAGLLAARDLNGVGVRGVAPRANLRSFNLLQDLTSANELDAMTRQMDVVAVSNNSWGDAWDSTGLLTFADPLWLQGVTRGATEGRGGRGVVYFWASGNG